MLKFYNFTPEHQLLLIAAKEDYVHNKKKDHRGFEARYDANGVERYDYDTMIEALECGWVTFHKGTEPYRPDEENHDPDEPFFSESGEECSGIAYIKVKKEHMEEIGE